MKIFKHNKYIFESFNDFEDVEDYSDVFNNVDQDTKLHHLTLSFVKEHIILVQHIDREEGEKHITIKQTSEGYCIVNIDAQGDVEIDMTVPNYIMFDIIKCGENFTYGSNNTYRDPVSLYPFRNAKLYVDGCIEFGYVEIEQMKYFPQIAAGDIISFDSPEGYYGNNQMDDSPSPQEVIDRYSDYLKMLTNLKESPFYIKPLIGYYCSIEGEDSDIMPSISSKETIDNCVKYCNNIILNAKIQKRKRRKYFNGDDYFNGEGYIDVPYR